MKFLRGFLTNLTMVLSFSLLVVLIVDRRNPMMGFLSSTAGTVLIAACCVSAFACALSIYVAWVKLQRKK